MELLSREIAQLGVFQTKELLSVLGFTDFYEPENGQGPWDLRCQYKGETYYFEIKATLKRLDQGIFTIAIKNHDELMKLSNPFYAFVGNDDHNIIIKSTFMVRSDVHGTEGNIGVMGKYLLARNRYS